MSDKEPHRLIDGTADRDRRGGPADRFSRRDGGASPEALGSGRHCQGRSHPVETADAWLARFRCRRPCGCHAPARARPSLLARAHRRSECLWLTLRSVRSPQRWRSPAAAMPPAVEPRPIAIARAEPEKRPRRVDTPSEIVSFIPLSPEARQDLLGSFQVARVLLPREVLADLGVVPDASRVGGPIQADVVFGEDGLARAIRLADQKSREVQ